MTVRASDTTAQRPGIGCLNNRYHDPTLGSFLSVDPLVAQTGDPYVYGAANPTTYSDPDGLDPDTSAWIRDEVEANGGCTYSSGLQCFLDKGSNPPEDGTLDVSAWYNDGLYQYGRASAGYGRVPGYGIQERGDGGPDWLDRLGHSVRFAANLPLTTPSVMWAEVTGGNCSIESGAVVVCVGMPGWANGPADSLTVGAIMSDGSQVSGQHLEHETNHVNQSAVLGPVYLQSWIAGTILSIPVDLLRGCQIGTHNPLEAHAGPGGGYGC